MPKKAFLDSLTQHGSFNIQVTKLKTNLRSAWYYLRPTRKPTPSSPIAGI